MNDVDKIYKGKKLIAIVFRKNFKVKELEFFTDKKNPFQIGAHDRKKGIKLKPHIHHIKKTITIKNIQEWLLLEKGKLLITLYTKKGKTIKEVTLKTGDSILLMDEGHGVEFLKDSRIFEIKQGPHIEHIQSKIFLE